MTNKGFLNFHTIVYTVFAVGLFVFPHFLWPMYGLQLNDKYAVFLSQHTSIFLEMLKAKVNMLKKYFQPYYSLIF